MAIVFIFESGGLYSADKSQFQKVPDPCGERKTAALDVHD
jgi:hypothetical protein